MGLTSTPPRIPVIHIGMPKAATKTDHYYILEQAGTNVLLTRCAVYKDDDVVLSDIAKTIA